jgi:hypothetical protein
MPSSKKSLPDIGTPENRLLVPDPFQLKPWKRDPPGSIAWSRPPPGRKNLDRGRPSRADFEKKAGKAWYASPSKP